MVRRFWFSRFVMVSIVLVNMQSAWGLDNGLADRPPMGWNTWYSTFGNILAPGRMTEEYIKANAQALVDTGLSDLGYTIIGLDCGWSQGRRDENEEN